VREAGGAAGATTMRAGGAAEPARRPRVGSDRLVRAAGVWRPTKVDAPAAVSGGKRGAANAAAGAMVVDGPEAGHAWKRCGVALDQEPTAVGAMGCM